MGNIITRIVHLPCGINGTTCMDGNDDFNIYINADIGYYEQLKAFIHEIKHINKKHFNEGIRALIAELEVEE